MIITITKTMTIDIVMCIGSSIMIMIMIPPRTLTSPGFVRQCMFKMLVFLCLLNQSDLGKRKGGLFAPRLVLTDACAQRAAEMHAQRLRVECTTCRSGVQRCGA